MPQLDKSVIKARAAQLRAKGDAALAGFLDQQLHTRQRVLIERAGRGRLDNFAEVCVPGTQAGETISADILRRDGSQLIGRLSA